MSLQETALIQQASLNTQRKAEIRRGQKEADQGFRQMYADCIKTLETHGSLMKEEGLLNRVTGMALCTLPAVLFKKCDPRELLDYHQYVGLAETERESATVTIYSDTRSLDKSNEVTIEIIGSPDYLRINRHFDCAEVYSQARDERGANILDLRNYQAVLTSLDDFTKADPVPIPRDIAELGYYSDEELTKQLKRVIGRKRLLGESTSVFTVAWAAGLYVSTTAMLGPYIVVPIAGSPISGLVVYEKLNKSLGHQAHIIRNELAARGK